MSAAELTIVTGFEELDVERCLEIVQKVSRQFSVSTSGFSLYGEAVNLKHTAKVLRAAERTAFLLEGNGWRFHRTPVRHYAIDTFAVQADLGALNAEKWVAEFSAVFPVRQAWVVNAEYDFWQNAEDPLQYSSQGRSHGNLPTKSNGLPPPLEQTVIDTSKNPGRRSLHVGYVEAVGTPMWIGEEFWELTGASKDDILSEAWMNAEVTAHGLVFLRPSNRPFSSSDDESAKMQQTLRSFLYPQK